MKKGVGRVSGHKVGLSIALDICSEMLVFMLGLFLLHILQTSPCWISEPQLHTLPSDHSHLRVLIPNLSWDRAGLAI